MKKFNLIAFLLGVLFLTSLDGQALPPARQIYEIRVYHYKTADQEQILDKYLKEALLPALHRNNILQVGVFKPITNENDTARRLYVLIPYSSFDQVWSTTDKVANDAAYQTAGKDYLEAPFDHPPYQRMEKIFAKAFPDAPVLQPSAVKGPVTERVYEMRSYESATEKLHAKKVKMFNDGKEIGIFKRLGFNAVFYSQALTGAALPNLFYMITFENMAAHDKLWNSFRDDPEWKKLSALDEYANSVSKANSFLLHPTEYSDY